MHASVRRWTAAVVEQFDLADRRTLEVGARNVNGTVRDLFTGEYVGVDQVAGDGVDQVATAADLPFGDGSFDVCLCLEMVEHDGRFWASLAEIGRVLRPGGYLLLTTRGIGFPYHAFPKDFYRFTEEAVELLLAIAATEKVVLKPDAAPYDGWLALGQKTPGVGGERRDRRRESRL